MYKMLEKIESQAAIGLFIYERHYEEITVVLKQVD